MESLYAVLWGTDLSFYDTRAGSIQISPTLSPKWFLFSLSSIDILWMRYVKHINRNVKRLLICHFSSSSYKCSQKRLFVKTAPVKWRWSLHLCDSFLAMNVLNSCCQSFIVYKQIRNCWSLFLSIHWLIAEKRTHWYWQIREFTPKLFWLTCIGRAETKPLNSLASCQKACVLHFCSYMDEVRISSVEGFWKHDENIDDFNKMLIEILKRLKQMFLPLNSLATLKREKLKEW